MKYEITKEKLEEMVCCIVDCGLDRDEACDYAFELLREDIDDVEEL